MTVFLHMGDVGKRIRVVVKADPEIERRFFHGISFRDAIDQQMRTETVNFFLHRSLKSLHHQERHNHCGESDGDADDGDPVNDGGESCCRGGYTTGNKT